ncbi:DarT ssDNA thymidine ADP-ribosyltransferase family protein [Rufibacter quisquiliarum]|uniref:DarT domain-containing protein n=1 Tax=Rufibacter quisquiliarum TaxID=1549639 RepID=A0A839GLV6_9BACT|nr:DarT ssDNA thymidine ADP-ribosyltransferase family protein [Rufibacter quisquiliarum]MBA9079812.1 hypothetical protein [Rufibacter quisquiliarum]
MAKPPKEGKLLYHLTALQNLEGIFASGLQPRGAISTFYNVADQEILGHRQEFGLDAYVPFHFFAPTPFAGAVQLKDPHTDFAYITIRRDTAKALSFNIIPSHPLNYKSQPLSYDDGILSIDWDTMALRDYNSNDCKEVCMAECISNKPVNPNDFNCIYVKTEDNKKWVEDLYLKITNQKPRFFVSVLPNIFVNHD